MIDDNRDIICRHLGLMVQLHSGVECIACYIEGVHWAALTLMPFS